jgi:hypothetical protein
MPGVEGVNSTYLLTAWGPVGHPKGGREVLMITVVTGPNRTEAETNAYSTFLEALRVFTELLNASPSDR